MDLRSADIAAARLADLLRLFPEARSEDRKVDFEKLGRAVGAHTEVGRERFGLTWPGKADSFRTIQTPSIATLRPCRDESVNFDEADNFIIEGDNLEVLKLLQKAYVGRVNMIYIDPPYNTGNDFIYPDNYAESLRTYLEYTGQVDSEGRKFSTNSEADGRFHSRWLTMMYPRLYLARNLLRDDGVIFMSIDDREAANLRLICDELFGEVNFVGDLIWRSRTSISNDQEISLNHNHTLVYARDRQRLSFAGESLRVGEYSNPDSDPRGPWKAVPLDANKPGGDTRYAIRNPQTGKDYLPPNGRSWSVNPAEYQRRLEDGRITFGAKGDSAPKQKLFLSERQERGDTKTPSSILLDAGTTQSGTEELMTLFDGRKVFDYPKPSSFIARLLDFGCPVGDDSLVLDFFAGSGPTAQAVLEWAKGRPKFILVQLPERIDSAKPYAVEAQRLGFETIADICKERVRRVIVKMGSRAVVGAASEERSAVKGFRVLKLDRSNFRVWDVDQRADTEALIEQLELHVDHVRDDRSDEDLLYEVILKSGFPLTTEVTRVDTKSGRIYSVADGSFLLCFERALTLDLILEVSARRPLRAVFLDEGFAHRDELKANAAQILRATGTVSFMTI
jgi:adenine-specific DNA-methyltransferase